MRITSTIFFGFFLNFVSIVWACDPTDLISVDIPKYHQPINSEYLTTWEIEALSRYTQQDYDWVNSDLRSDNTAIEGDLLKFVQGIDGALNKIRTRIGRSYRGTRLPQKVLDGYVEHSIVSDRAYTSTSASAKVVMHKWNPESNGVFLAIDGTSGRDITQYAYLPDEQEVLFPRSVKFEVLSRCLAQGQTKNYWVIHLKEVNN